LSKNYKRG